MWIECRRIVPRGGGAEAERAGKPGCLTRQRGQQKVPATSMTHQLRTVDAVSLVVVEMW
jgi:hypothetical protein